LKINFDVRDGFVDFSWALRFRLEKSEGREICIKTLLVLDKTDNVRIT
jgi:hypothetical protein